MHLADGIFVSSEFLDTNAGRSRSLDHPTIPYFDKAVDGAGGNNVRTPLIPIDG